MTDRLSKLVARAWDQTPRLRPQIAPRFAPTTASGAGFEEAWGEVEATPAKPGRAETGMRAAAQAQAPNATAGEQPGTPTPGARATTPVRAERTSATPPRTVEPVATHVERREREVTRVVEERTTVVREAPVAALPPALREADRAALRPPPAPQHGMQVVRAAAPAPRTVAGPREGAPAIAPERDVVHVSIGRIDVRAAFTSAAAPARGKAPARDAALPLADYLRQRHERR